MPGFPDPTRRCPVTLPDGTEHQGTVFLNRVLTHPDFIAGDYTYASDFDPPEDWAARLAPYLFEGRGDRLILGKFCQIAHGVRFITSGANHAMDGATTFPFPIFDPEQILDYRPDQRDTVIGHDVWFGTGAMVCPGARIGNGAIIGAGAVVRGVVPAYAVVIGNPGIVHRMRHDPETVARLERLAWWDWPAEVISANVSALLAGDLDALEQSAP